MKLTDADKIAAATIAASLSERIVRAGASTKTVEELLAQGYFKILKAIKKEYESHATDAKNLFEEHKSES